MPRVYDLAPPRNWQDFEDLCLDLFRVLWDAPSGQKNGRGGQPQAGVDVFGLPTGSAKWFGVQCKKKHDAAVTKAELDAEVEKAKGFNPQLTRFVLATTARCDAAIQEVAREWTERGPFEVLVYDWDHFCTDLAGQTEILRDHFPDHFASDPSDLQSHYLRHLVSELDVVDMSKVSRDQKSEIHLSKVYIDLDVMAEIHVKDQNPSVRTGSSSLKFALNYINARCAYRDGNRPVLILWDFGFRLVAPFEYLRSSDLR